MAAGAVDCYPCRMRLVWLLAAGLLACSPSTSSSPMSESNGCCCFAGGGVGRASLVDGQPSCGSGMLIDCSLRCPVPGDSAVFDARPQPDASDATVDAEPDADGARSD